MRKFVFSLVLMVFAAGLFSQSIKVVDPRKNWANAIGKVMGINWTKSGTMANTVKILLYRGAAFIQTIAPSANNSANSPALNSYTWTIPTSVPKGYYRVRVQTTDNAVYGDSEDFVIWDEGILVLGPNGGENLTQGKSYTIRWHRVGYGSAISFTIELWKDGVKVGDVTAGTDMHISNHYFETLYTYDWSVGQCQNGMADAGSGYKIKVLCEYNSSDESDGPFQISVDIMSSWERFNHMSRIPIWVPRTPGGCPECLVFDLKELQQILTNEAKPLDVALFIDDVQAASLGKFGRSQIQSPTVQVKLRREQFQALQAGGRRFQLKFFDAGRLIHSQDIAVEFRR